MKSAKAVVSLWLLCLLAISCLPPCVSFQTSQATLSLFPHDLGSYWSSKKYLNAFHIQIGLDHLNRNRGIQGNVRAEVFPFYASSSSSSSTSSLLEKKTDQTSQNSKHSPWMADYATSSKTQKSIKAAAKQRASPIVRASSVLKTLLRSDATKCNPSNLVCALTLSAKIVPKRAQRRHEFRDLLHQALDILSTLVEEERLHVRQLANAVWAIAKHYTSDEEIFPPYFGKYHNAQCFASTEEEGRGGISSSSIVYIAEKWNLNEESKYEREEKLIRTVEMIAQQLLDKTMVGLSTSSSHPYNKMSKGMNQVEASMVLWAYAVLFPRNIPAGWELPPRVGFMKSTTGKTVHEMVDSDDETIIYETIQDSKSYYNSQPETLEEPKSIVDKMYDAIADEMIQCIEGKNSTSMLEQCQWKELSTIAWSFANRGYCKSPSAQTLILNLANLAISRLENSQQSSEKVLPRDIAEIAWALGTLQSDCHNLSDALEKFVAIVNDNVIDKSLDRPLQEWKSADCVQMAIALGHARLDQRNLLQEIYREALISVKETLKNAEQGIFSYNTSNKMFLDFELVVLLWVQARLYLTADYGVVFDEFAEILPQMILYRMCMLHDSKNKSLQDVQKAFDRIHLGSQEQANIAWSLTVLEKYHSTHAVELISKIFSVCSASCKDGNLIQLEHAHQLWQSMVILQHECPDAVKHVDPETFQFLKSAWNQEKTRQKSSSARHHALSQTLKFMGVKHYNEYDEDIDLALVLKVDSKWTHAAEHTDYSSTNMSNKQRVAIEFDGPTHFTKIPNTSVQGQTPKPPRALGHTVLKYKLLKTQGWTIVRIPFYEFDRIPFWASMERQRYLQRKLKTHANLRFSSMDVSEYKALVPNRNSRYD